MGCPFLFNKFNPPVIDGGQIYVPNYNGGVDLYRFGAIRSPHPLGAKIEPSSATIPSCCWPELSRPGSILGPNCAPNPWN